MDRLSQRGAIKLTDYLETPVDTSTLSTAEIHERLTQGLVLFGSFLITENNKYTAYSYIGYIPTQTYGSYLYNTTDSKRPFVVMAYHGSNSFDVYIPLFHNAGSDATAVPTHECVRNDSGWRYNTKGKIWIGDYKQIVQE